jgi:flagellar basal body rod protein FlgC|tara:strand:+ start:493 stop:636 length:144 start_codon:yes stop_codon:yes gene_type:complete
MPKLEITEEMLDAIEAVKGRREANYWDPECRKYYEANQKAVKNTKKS